MKITEINQAVEALKQEIARARADAADNKYASQLWSQGELSGLQRALEIISKAPEIPEGFIPWSGGPCPVGPDDEVEVISYAGYQAGPHKAHRVNWNSPDRRIQAYRLAPPRRQSGVGSHEGGEE